MTSSAERPFRPESPAETSPGRPARSDSVGNPGPSSPVASSFPLRLAWMPRLTSAGWIWLGVILVMMLIGLAKRINLLTLLACLFVVLWLLNALLVRLNLRGLRGKRRIGGPVFAWQPFWVEAIIENTGSRARLAVSLETQGAGPLLAWFTPKLAGGLMLRFQREVLLAHRGRHAWSPLEAVTAYPFGLFEWKAALTPAGEILVLPRLGRLHRGRFRRFLASSSLLARQAHNRPQRRLTAQTEFHGLRAFRSGDSPKWIHWRTTARRGELMVREFEDLPANNLILVVDLWREDQAEEDPARSRLGSGATLLEDAVSLAATICWEWRRRQGERIVLAVAGGQPVVLAGEASREHSLRLLECLAVQQGDAVLDRTAVVDRLLESHLPAAPVVLISTRGSVLEEILAQKLNRPVNHLTATCLAGFDFYEPPAASRKTKVALPRPSAMRQ